MLIRQSDKPDVVNTAFTVTLDGPFLPVHRPYAFTPACTSEVTIISASINPHKTTGKCSADMHESDPTQVSAHTVNTSAIDAYPPRCSYPTNILTAASAKLRRNAHGTDLDLDLIKSMSRRSNCWSKYQ